MNNITYRKGVASPREKALEPNRGNFHTLTALGLVDMKPVNLISAAHIVAVFCTHFAVAMLAPALVDFIDGNLDWQIFFTSSLIIGSLSIMTMLATSGHEIRFTTTLGFLLVNLLWLAATLCSALPYMLCSLDLSLSDAIFESVSGLTTTGSTVINGLDDLPRGLLLWRSITQWIGGIGMIGMGIIMLPLLRIGGMQFFRLESSDRSDKAMPRFAPFALSVVRLYVVLTLLCTISYYVTGMSMFDAVNHAMTTLSSGGFSTHDASMGYFPPQILWVGSVFMLLGALPFAAMVLAVSTRNIKRVFEPQVPVLLGIIAVTAGLVVFDLVGVEHMPFAHAVTLSTFNIISIITTTGYAANDYSIWGPFALAMVFLVTFFGGCAGSTAGGVKTYRLIVMVKILSASIRNLTYPHGVFPIRLGGKIISGEVRRSVTIFLIAFMVSLLLLTLAVSATGTGFLTSFTGVLTAITNVGPGLGPIIGPAGNFSSLPDAAKLILALAMLLGRLEIMTVLVIFSPTFWRQV